jgi:3-oxoacyl-[acyl-carrier-protein] synthase III
VGTVPVHSPTQRETTALAASAAEDCLRRSAYSRHDLGLLIFAGVYRNDFLLEPAIAALVAGQLGLGTESDTVGAHQFFAFDVFNGALGFLNACHVAIQLMRTMKNRASLIVASEIENNLEIWPDRLLSLEETGSALLLAEDEDEGMGTRGFGEFFFKSYEEYADALLVYTGQRAGKPCLYFERDPRLEAYYQECILDAVTEFLSEQRRDLSDIDLVFLPQVSCRLLEGLRAGLSIPEERCVNALQPGYDLFTSSLPLALRYAHAQGMVRPGDVGLIVGVGSGIQVGCVLYDF